MRSGQSPEPGRVVDEVVDWVIRSFLEGLECLIVGTTISLWTAANQSKSRLNTETSSHDETEIRASAAEQRMAIKQSNKDRVNLSCDLITSPKLIEWDVRLFAAVAESF